MIDIRDLGGIFGKTLYFDGKPFTGTIAVINGYNGYTSTEDDGMMCAIINNSCWTGTEPNPTPNLLRDEQGNSYRSKNLRGISVEFVNGIRKTKGV